MMNEDTKKFARYTTKTADQVCAEFNTSAAIGLADHESAARHITYGFNEIKSSSHGWASILLAQFKSPFIYLLLGACALYFFLENRFDALVILSVVSLNALLGFFQEYHANKVVESLQQYIVAYVAVMRDGKEVKIASKELVPGDIVLLYPGDIIPADIRFLQESYVLVDESSLTGESDPIKKNGLPLDQEPQTFFQAQNIGFSGTTIISGKAKGVVLSIGSMTTLGTIAKLTSQTSRLSNFEKNLGLFSSFIIRLMMVSLVIVFGANLFIKAGKTDVLELILFACSLAITVIPEALPLIMTFALSQGALRMARSKAVVKRLSAIEDLGDVEILCTDKTGTLTENSSSVEAIFSTDERQTLLYGFLAANTSVQKNTPHSKGFDGALRSALTDKEYENLEAYQQIRQMPFDSTRLRDAVLVQVNHSYELVMRGAPEQVLPLCAGMTHKDTTDAKAWTTSQGTLGRRVLAVAKRMVQPTEIKQEDISVLEHDLEFLGLIAFGDPLKKTAIEAIAKARNLGVEIKILSGDTAEVCGNVAHAVGLIADVKDVVTGQQFAQLRQDEKEAVAKKTSVFARVSPEQKYEIIVLLQREKVVAYMGDGINDAPALKVAHVALAVQDAAGIAREASDIILLKKSLLVIIDGIEEGRRVFANTLKYVRTVLSVTFGNFYSLAFASLILDYLPMLPVQLLLVNVLPDLPNLALATDTVNPDELRRPSKYDVHRLIMMATILGLISSVFDFIFFAFFYHVQPAQLQTSWFIESVLTALIFIFSIRTNRLFFRTTMPSLPLCIASCAIAALAVSLPYTALGQRAFSFVALPVNYVLLIIGLVVVYFFTTDLVKVLYYRVYENNNSTK